MIRKIFTFTAITSVTLTNAVLAAPHSNAFSAETTTYQIGSMSITAPTEWGYYEYTSGTIDLGINNPGGIFQITVRDEKGLTSNQAETIIDEVIGGSTNYVTDLDEYVTEKFTGYFKEYEKSITENDSVTGMVLFINGSNESYCINMTDINQDDFDYTRDYTRILDSIIFDGTASSISTSVGAEQERYNAGTYKVGSDIPAGEYVLFASDSHGYFSVSSDSSGSFDSIICNDNFDAFSIVTVNDGQYFEISRAYAMPIENVPTLDTTSSGTFKIGYHLPAGEYRLEADDGHGYYAVLSNSLQTFDSIIANDNFESNAYISVSEGQYLELSRCHIAQ